MSINEENELEHFISESYSKVINKKLKNCLFYDYILASYSEEEQESDEENYEKIEAVKFIPQTRSPIPLVRSNSLINSKPSKNINVKKISWQDNNEIDDSYINSLIKEKEISETPQISLLTKLIIGDIYSKSDLATFANIATTSSESSCKFTVNINLSEKNTSYITKNIVVKDSASVDEIVGYCLHMCEIEDYEIKIDTDIHSYQLFTEEESDGKVPKELPKLAFAKCIDSNILFLKYLLKDITAELIFHAKTSTSKQTSKSYNLSLNNNFKNIITQYLESRNLKSDGGFDVYVYKSKIFIRDIDISMLKLKEHVDENNRLEIEIVYFDDSTPGDAKQTIAEEPTFDLFRHVSLILTLTSVDVSVAIDRNIIEIDPLPSNKSLFGKIKSIHVQMCDIKICETKSVKSNMRKQLKIKYIEGDIKKTVLLEATTFEIDDMNKKINEYLRSTR